MDLLSVSASITALLQLTGTVIGYLSDVKGAPKEIQGTRLEICSVLPILTILQDQADQARQGDSWSSTLNSLNVPNGPLQQFQTALERLESKLAPVKGLKKVGKAIAWPFEKDEVQSILNTIERQKLLFNLARQNDHIALSKAIKGDVETIHRRVDDIGKGVTELRVSEKQDQIHSWLSAPDPSSNYNKALKDRHARTGDWFIKSKAYFNWLSNPSSLLWLYGIPGCGKSILISTIIQETVEYCRSRTNAAVLYFYFDFNDTKKQQHEPMIRSLVSQLSMHCPSVPVALEALYSSCMDGERQPIFDALLETLHQLLITFEESFIILDALDECEERQGLLANIERIFDWKDRNCRMLATSRREKDIADALVPLANDEGSLCIQSALVNDDIRAYVHYRLETDPKLKRWQKEQREIEDTLMNKANGMFRWAACQLDELRSCRNVIQLRRALKPLPETLDKTYARILCRIKGEDRQYALKILQWLVFSARPLCLAEVAEVIAIDVNDAPQFDAERRFADPHDILEICSSLVTVEIGPSPVSLHGDSDVEPDVVSDAELDAESDDDKKRLIIRLAHFSVKEYLISDRIRDGPATAYSLQEIPSNKCLAEDCVIYLLQFDGPDSLTHYTFEEYPLAKYAARYWTEHARITEESTTTTIELSQELFMTQGEALVNWVRMYDPNYGPDDQNLRVSPNDVAPPLYYASCAGLIRSVRLLIDKGVDINASGGSYGNALQAASWSGYIEIVRLLLDNGADVNAQGGYYGNALQAASRGGTIEIVRLLLDNRADINAQGGCYQNALQAAIRDSNIEIVRLLLENGADVNSRGGYYKNALQAAIIDSNIEIVRLLLDNRADVNAWSEGYSNAVQAAAEMPQWSQRARTGDRVKVFQMLLDEGGDVNSEVLKAVALRRDENMFQILLNHGISPRLEDTEGRFILHFASGGSSIRTFKGLLKLGSDLNATDKQGRNCLHHAAARGSNEIVSWLLQKGLDPNCADRDGWTPLHWAAKGGEPEKVATLETFGAIFSLETIRNWTPKDVAVFHRHEISWISSCTTAMDSAQQIKPGKYQDRVICDNCDLIICGPRYKCQNCPDFDYCFKCMHSSDDTHPGHIFDVDPILRGPKAGKRKG